MRIGSALAIYVLFWAIALFVILPIGVRTAREEGAPLVPGQADSAPQTPMIWRKLGASALLAGVLFALFYANYVNGWVTFDDLPLPGPDR